jgi:hypothetical protein
MPIEHYFKGLEEMIILATKYPPEFTIEQMVGKVKTAMKKCRLFQLHLNEWSQLTLVNSDWDNMKHQFGKAYKSIFLILGRRVGVPGTIENTQELLDKENDGINTFTDVMSTMQMMSNANAQSVNAGMTAMGQQMVTLRVEVQSSRQVLVNNTMWTLPPAALAPQWAPAMTPSPNNCPPPQAPPPSSIAYATIPNPATRWLLQDSQTFTGHALRLSSSNSAGKAGDVGAKEMQEEDAECPGKHRHLVSSLHQQA